MFQQRFGYDLLGWPFRQNDSILKGQHSIRIGKSLLRIVSRQDDEIAFLTQAGDLIHDARLITHIQISGWLIHNNDPCLLCHGTGNQHHLTFTTADPGVTAGG